MKETKLTMKTYTCVIRCCVSDVRGNVTVYKPGDSLPAAKFKTLNDIQRAKFAISGDYLSDDLLLSAIMNHHDDGDLILGGYDDVWSRLLETLASMGYTFSAPFCHFRALQIARVGRVYQTKIGSDSFGDLCPDLADHASDWSN